MSDRMNAMRRWWSGGGGPDDGARSSRVTREVNRSSERRQVHETPYQRLRIPRSLNYPTTSIGRVLDQTADRFPEAPALEYGDLRWDYHQLRQKTQRVAGGLANLGVRKGDRVLMALPNCPEFVTVFMAAQKLGAVVVNAGPLIGVDDLRRLIEMTEPRVVVGLDLQATMITPAGLDRPKLKWLWVSLIEYQSMWKWLGYHVKLWQSHPELPAGHDQLTMNDVLEAAPPVPPTVQPDPDDVAVLQPTGGTTGTLKVARLTHRNILSNVVQMATWVDLRHGQERVVTVLPMFHVFGLSVCMLAPIFTGGLIVPLTRFQVEQLLDVITRCRPTVLPIVPLIAEAMCDAIEADPRPDVCDVLQHCTVISGSAPLSLATSQRFEMLTGAKIVQGYGLTESSPVTHANPIDDPRSGSIGLPMPDTDVRVVDLNDPTKDVTPGESGELLVSGPQVFGGYLHNPEETDKVLHVDRDGHRWLHTGDVVSVDDDGFYYVVDRRKHMINRAGLKVWPAKVERVLSMHPRVKDVAVIGRPDPVYSEVVTAVVVPSESVDGFDALAEELRALCREHLAPYEVPSRFEIVNELPRSALGKLMKHRLAEEKRDSLDLDADEIDMPRLDEEAMTDHQDVSGSDRMRIDDTQAAPAASAKKTPDNGSARKERN
ncbi:MAG: AMP-binding protein [Phycisphaera sp.]|nr:AMP-binding protein [Phycisphaera sp.]